MDHSHRAVVGLGLLSILILLVLSRLLVTPRRNQIPPELMETTKVFLEAWL